MSPSLSSDLATLRVVRILLSKNSGKVLQSLESQHRVSQRSNATLQHPYLSTKGPANHPASLSIPHITAVIRDPEWMRKSSSPKISQGSRRCRYCPSGVGDSL